MTKLYTLMICWQFIGQPVGCTFDYDIYRSECITTHRAIAEDVLRRNPDAIIRVPFNSVCKDMQRREQPA